jgi:hypothetical protein
MMTAHAQLDTICKPSAHDFVPKRQETIWSNGNAAGGADITEVYCRKCGTVCFLTRQPESRIAIVRPS